MIFQSQIESTTKNSKQQGVIYMLLGAALILIIALFVKFPIPEPVVENPIVYMKFVSLGESETGGPAMENSSGDGGGDESAQPQNASSNNEVDANANEGSGDHVIKKNSSSNTNTNTSENNPKPEKNSAFTPSKKKGKPLGDGESNMPGGPGNGTDNIGNIWGKKDGKGHLPAEQRPKQIKPFEFADEASDISTIRYLKVLLSVDCKGVIKSVAAAPGTTDMKNFDFVKKRLVGNKYFKSTDANCEGTAKWIVDVTITP